MKKTSILFFVLLFNMASILAQDSIISSNQKANVYIISNEFKVISHKFNFYNNDKYIGSLKGRNYLKYECDAGKQLFWASAENKDFIELFADTSEVYIIEVEYNMSFFKGRVKLNLVPRNSENYNYLVASIIKKEPIQSIPDQIEKKNIKRKHFIDKSLNKYNSKKQRELNFNNDISEYDSIVGIETKLQPIIYNPIILDYNFVDFPFSSKSIELSGTMGLIANPSMSQSLNITSSFNSLTREGLYRLMISKPSTKRYYKFSALVLSVLTYLPMPLTSGWEHEEFHRAVLAKHGGNSYNEMNDFPITKSLISVLKVKDEDLIRLKIESPQDMVRMSEAGIEGQYLLANTINNIAFYYNTKSISYVPILNAYNSIFYVIMCSRKNIDKETIAMNDIEGSNIEKRDLVGLDFLAYTYDLFRPNEPYENRGIHPSGVGIDRYIKRSQMTSDELSYLKQQGWLQLINFANPISFMFTSFTVRKNENGDDTRANLYLNHWLTSFGYEISSTALLHHNKHNYAFTLHNYVNYYHWFPGLELETYNYLLGDNKIKKPIPISARMMIWTQPENQLFFSKKYQLGALAEMKIYYPINKYFHPYISVTAKTEGWVAGNVYLEPNISYGFGLRTYF